MCPYKYMDKDSFLEYCELLDRPCDEQTLQVCPLLNE